MEPNGKTLSDSIMENVIEGIAKTCHQANKAFCESLGDLSQKNWEECEDWQRTSAINGVKFRIDNPTAGPGAQHEAWMQEKLKDGWVYGPVKDANAKTHPCLVAYDELPNEQKTKDKLFQGVVDGILSYTEFANKKQEPSVLQLLLSGVNQEKLTYGQKAVGLTFNHGEGPIFEQIQESKLVCAHAIDLMDGLREASQSGEYKALSTLAIRKLQSAQMDMVKAITWRD